MTTDKIKFSYHAVEQPTLPVGHRNYVRIEPPAGALSAGVPDSHQKPFAPWRFNLFFKLQCYSDEKWHPANGLQFSGVSLSQR
jgi:hypothetical protein